MKTLIELFLKRPLLVNVLMLVIILIGTVSVFTMNRQLFPNVKFDLAFITTLYPGASPIEVEQNVTRHIEEEIKSVSGMKKYVSYSTDNVSKVVIEVDPEAEDPRKVVDDIRRAMARVTELPNEVEGQPVVDELVASDIPIMEFGITGEIDYQILRDIAKNLTKEIEDIDGVKNVDRVGYRDREIHININPQKMEENYLSIQELLQAIPNRNVRVQGGSIETEDSIRYIMTLSQFEDIEDIREVIVRANYSGKVVRIKDIAEVQNTFEKETIRNRINRKQGISFIVVKKASYDQIRLADKVKTVLDKNRKLLQKKYGDVIKIEEVYDTSYFVKNRLKTIIYNAIIGFILVLVTLFIFLNLKVALWTAMGIPVAVFFGFTLMKSVGLSINAVTMGSFIMVLGMLVDDAIIVGENIYRHRLNGQDPYIAAKAGLKEVFWPVICTVITTVVAFTPLLGIKDMMGKFVWAIPVIVSITLIGSLLDCFFILPNHITYSKFDHKNSLRKEGLIDFLRKKYSKILGFCLSHRYLVVLFATLLFIGALVFYIKKINFRMFPEDAAEVFYVKVEAERGDSLNKTEKLIHIIERSIVEEAGNDLTGVVTHIGSSNEWGESEGVSFPHEAIVFAFLTSANDRERKGREIMELVQKKVGNPDGIKQIRFILDAGGPPTGRAIDTNIHCDNDQKRKHYTDLVYNYIKTIPGASAIRRTDNNEYEQIYMQIDYDKVARLGLNVSDIASTIRFSFDGIKTTEIIKSNEVIEVRLGFPKKYRQDTQRLLNLAVRNNQNRLIKVSKFATIGKRIENASIFHYDGEVTTKIYGELKQNITTTRKASKLIREKFQKIFDADPGVSMSFSGEADVAGQSIRDLMRSFFIAVCLIYVILLLLFNSLTQPILIMLAIPFGLIGVVFTLFVHGIPMSFMSAIGVIGLSGVVVNDSLVMVNFINSVKNKLGQDKERLLNIKQVISDAAVLRLRPIILTTVTTVCGLLPTAYGIGGSDIFVRRLVLPLAWGLIFATALTLILIPCFYHIDYDLKKFVRGNKGA